MQLTEHSLQELEGLMTELGEPVYRAKQTFQWLSRGVRPQGMLNLPKALRDKLSDLPYGGAETFQVRCSAKDGTKKYLFLLDDENLVEGVFMRYHYGNTACISTQVGCRMGCKFCASTLEGRVRDLTAGEMLMEVAAVANDNPTPDNGQRTVTNLVLMGSGEPLDNFDNVVKFLRLVTDPDGMGFSPRNISVSTCGLVPMIDRFMAEAPHVTLSVSLHAHSDAVRSSIMPVNDAYPIAQLLAAAKRYAEGTGRRVVFEYALISGVNDSQADAAALAKRLRGILCHVNLIPLNAVEERDLTGTSKEQAQRFLEALEREHVSATIRREMGADIEGACGQLRRRVKHDLRI